MYGNFNEETVGNFVESFGQLKLGTQQQSSVPSVKNVMILASTAMNCTSFTFRSEYSGHNVSLRVRKPGSCAADYHSIVAVKKSFQSSNSFLLAQVLIYHLNLMRNHSARTTQPQDSIIWNNNSSNGSSNNDNTCNYGSNNSNSNSFIFWS